MTPVEYLAYSFGISLVIFLIPGQMFFLSLSVAIRSLRSGIMVALGLLIGQLLLMSLFAIGFLVLLRNYLEILRILGAVLLFWLGASALKEGRKSSISDPRYKVDSPFARGLLLTVLNPPYILWLLTIGSTVLSVGENALGYVSYWIFSCSVITSSMLVTLIIVFVTNRGGRAIGHAGVRALQLASGSALIALGIALLAPFIFQ